MADGSLGEFASVSRFIIDDGSGDGIWAQIQPDMRIPKLLPQNADKKSATVLWMPYPVASRDG
jgi:hypothetical protein